MNIDKYLYEIIDDYKSANSTEEKNEIFNLFCSSVWGSKNKRRVYNRQIKFKVRSDLLDSEIGQIFNTWSEVDYVGYKSMSSESDWCSLIRQKINNLYTRYFDEEVILNKDYMNLLKTPYKLYYRWIKGVEMCADEITDTIESSIYKAAELKTVYQKQKMKLSWSEYKKVVEGFLRRAFDNCKIIEDYENECLTDKYIYNFTTEDNFYIRYICKSLDGEMLKWQKEYYGLRRGRNKQYIRCKECGDLIEKTGNKKIYCEKCAAKRKAESNRKSDKKYKIKMRENRKLA